MFIVVRLEIDVIMFILLIKLVILMVVFGMLVLLLYKVMCWDVCIGMRIVLINKFVKVREVKRKLEIICSDLFLNIMRIVRELFRVLSRYKVIFIYDVRRIVVEFF